MAEYIEREKIWTEFNAARVPYNRAAQKAIDSIPAADVRPVVLCKDCIYYYCETCSRWADGTYMKPNDFCSRGAKREENNG